MKKFAAIEGLRGWMAWWVVLGHSVDITGLARLLHPWIAKFFIDSFLAVQIFMIVSGFVITHVLSIKQDSFRTYVVHRWFRLIPLMIAMLAVVLLTRDLYRIAWIDNPWIDGNVGRIARMQAEDRLWPIHMLLHLTLLHGLAPENLLPFASTTFLAPAWSLSLEWQFYLVAPMIIAGLTTLRQSGFTWFLIALSAPALLGKFGIWTSVYPLILLNLPFFLVGIASRQLLDRRIPVPTLLATAGAVIVYVATRGVNQIPLLILVGTGWGLFLFLTAREVGLVELHSRWLDRLASLIAYNPVVGMLGRISYSTYLCHVPVLSIIVGGGMGLTGRADQAIVMLLGAASVIVTIPASMLLYYLIEQPGVRLGKLLLRGPALGQPA